MKTNTNTSAAAFGCTNAVRDVLDMVADKWSLYVVAVLSNGPHRFTELRRAVTGSSQRMLTVPLRGLEREGIVTRTVVAVMPPNVTYELTPMGERLRNAIMPLINWSEAELDSIQKARSSYDEKNAATPTG